MTNTATFNKGVVRKIFTKSCVCNYSVANCVIVEFPDSDMKISDLPPHHFPLTPIMWKFSTSVIGPAGANHHIHVSRSQLNLQPVLAITGHAAQGKTLPQILVDLHKGGFAAYVSASRAQTQEGLFMTRTLVLKI